MSRITPLLPAVLLLTLAHPALAQPPAPAQPPPPPAPGQPPPPPPRLEASAQFTFLDTQGNTTTQALGAGGDWTWRPDPWTHRAKVIFAQNETGDDLTARSFDGLFRTTRAVGGRLSVYGQYDFLRDVFAGVEQRHVIEGGLSYKVVDTAPHRLRFDAGLGYLHERRPDDELNSATLSVGAAYRLAISTTSELTYEPRFLLPFAATDAWKFDQDVALALAINTIFSIKLSHTLRYSNDPPPGFDTTDRIMAISLVAKVRRPAR